MGTHALFIYFMHNHKSFFPAMICSMDERACVPLGCKINEIHNTYSLTMKKIEYVGYGTECPGITARSQR